jgi:hypothetical protein
VNSKKDFERAAALVRTYVLPERKHLCAVFVQFFQGENPRFDVGRFEVACNTVSANDGKENSRSGLKVS